MSYDFVAILVRDLLVRSPRKAEVDSDSEFLLESFVMDEQDVIVERECTQFRESFFDASDRALNSRNRHGVYLLEKGCTRLAISDVEHDAASAFPGDHEITLCIANVLSGVDIQGSFGDHPTSVDRDFCAVAVSFSEHLPAMRLNPSAVW